jgi:methylase of polypeptide subunit release factors
MDKRALALVELGSLLRNCGYRFVTPTPATHARVNNRPHNQTAKTLTDIFGWSRPFTSDALPVDMLNLLDQAEAVSARGGMLQSSVRYSTLGSLLLVHSAFPTLGQEDVFFGPDTYRFAGAITRLAREYPDFVPQRAIDIGAGSGAGGLFAAGAFPSLTEIVLGDVNAAALLFSEMNARLNGISIAKARCSDVLRDLPEPADLIISNPPYLVDARKRAYRHGGGQWGFDLSLRILDEALEKLTPGGKLVLYTGAPILNNVDLFREVAAERLLGHAWQYDEIDPDVFGEELEGAPYDQADRIAVVSLNVTGPAERRLST